MDSPEIVVIDYGIGNLLSVQRGLEHCGARVAISGDPEKVVAASRVVLPGVGAFSNAMATLHALGLVDAIRDVAARGVPLLGICLGMQLLFDESEEFGLTRGLGLLPGRVVPIPNLSVDGGPQKIPHIGWNALQPASTSWEGTLLADVVAGEAMYFVHSFQATPATSTDRLADCLYGGHHLSAMVVRRNVVGCQFHPEKSGPAGLKILSRFCAS